MIRINQTILDKTTKKARLSDRLRMNFNYHPQLDDPMQRMLNAIEPHSYIQPHKHEDPDKTEVFLILRGRMMVVEFNEQGEIVDCDLLDANRGRYGVEIPPRTFHSIISLEEGSVAYEIKNGPYLAIEDKCFASWAPKEGEATTRQFISQSLKRCREISKAKGLKW
jgi:cupin fold WbuC family metalloprotein